MWPRAFGQNLPQPERVIADDAPLNFRAEWLQLTFDAGRNTGVAGLNDRRLYTVINGTLGVVDPAVDPHGGLQHRALREVRNADWVRLYDLVTRLWAEFQLHGFGQEYGDAVNRLLAAHAIVWSLTNDGRLERVVPAAVQPLLAAAQEALQRPGYQAAHDLYALAKAAYDARPRRDRDVCANAFDAMESAAKIRMAMPAATFGVALDAAFNRQLINADVRAILRALEVARHHHCGHGMNVPFALTPDEVDFQYAACLMGANLFARMP